MPPPWSRASSSTCAISATNNFVGQRIDGYERPRCLLTAQAAAALAAIQRDLAARGVGLKVFDCYRPVRAVAHFVRWAQRIDDIKRKAEFYPDIDKRDLFKLGYIATRSGHSRGSTVDLTLARRADKAELDMGTPYDFSEPKSWLSDRSVSAEGRKNRALLVDAMTRGGFQALPQGMVALHAGERAVSRYVFRLSGAMSARQKKRPASSTPGAAIEQSCGSGQAALRLPAACLPRSVTTS